MGECNFGKIDGESYLVGTGKGKEGVVSSQSEVIKRKLKERKQVTFQNTSNKEP